MASRMFFYYSENDEAVNVEEQVLVEMLSNDENRRTRSLCSVMNLCSTLSGKKDSWVLTQLKTNLAVYEECYLLPSVPTGRFKELEDRMIPLTHYDVPGGMSLIDQVSAITGRQPTTYERLVGVYGLKGIEGLREATDDLHLIRSITLRDRLLHGGTMRDEATATRILERCGEARSRDRGYSAAYVYTNPPDMVPAKVQRAVMDHLCTTADMSCRIFALFAERILDGDVEKLFRGTCYLNQGKDTATTAALLFRQMGYETKDIFWGNNDVSYFDIAVSEGAEPTNLVSLDDAAGILTGKLKVL